MYNDHTPLSDGEGLPTTAVTRRLSFLSYHLLLLEAINTILVADQQSEQSFYLIPCTRSEFLIFLRLLCASSGYSVPFEELSLHPSAHRDDMVGPLQRHISRLRRKLPPSWTILCEAGFGYRLHVFATSFPPEHQDA